jgi:DNA primase
MQYLLNRGFTEETIKYFELGYNDDMRLINMPEFYNYISIPVHDLKDRIVAFMCRSIDSEAKQKHNSTYNFLPLYEKGRIFYNLNRVLRHYYRRTVFIVEGQFDCISMFQAGFKNTIASLTNGVTEIQAELLFRYFDKIYLVPDNDEAGSKLVESVKEMLSKNKRKELIIYRCKLPRDCKDANDALKKGYNIKKLLKESKVEI